MLLRRQIPQQQRQDDRDEPVKFKVASGWWYPQIPAEKYAKPRTRHALPNMLSGFGNVKLNKI